MPSVGLELTAPKPRVMCSTNQASWVPRAIFVFGEDLFENRYDLFCGRAGVWGQFRELGCRMMRGSGGTRPRWVWGPATEAEVGP